MSKNVFISWSGGSSHKVALLLYKWLPHFIQSIEPFLSSEDVRKGARWFSEISNELEQINFGVICITRDNLDAPWLLFEGGALSKSLGHSQVSPLLIDVTNSDLSGPLAQFNTTALTKEDFKRLIHSINLHLGERGIPRELLDGAFDIGWPVFETQLNETLTDLRPSSHISNVRSPSEILDEVLQLTRHLAQKLLSEPTQDIDLGWIRRVSSSRAAGDLIDQLKDLKDKDKSWRLLDLVSHELLAAIVGIRSNASLLQRRLEELTPEIIDQKLDDILMDCDLLLHHVDRLRYILGEAPFESRPEKIFLLRDVILKTINQLKPLVREKGLNPSNIEYEREHLSKVRVYARKAWLAQVVGILFINAIKYSNSGVENFKVRISSEETEDYTIIIFQDWGVGIDEGIERQIFEAGFRGPSTMDVAGAGLGLTIAQKLMRQSGGDLILGNRCNPTEFRVLIPKAAKDVSL